MDLTAPFTALFTFITNILKWSLDGVLWLLGKAFFLPFDGLLTVISTIFNAIDLSAFVASYAMNWAGLPPQMIWMINTVAIPQGLTVLAAAVGIRMALNLIPAAFTRI
jgi:hypothetical protein